MITRIFIYGWLVFIAGCGYFEKSDKSKDTARDSNTADTEDTAAETENGAATKDKVIDLSAIPPIQVTGNELVEIAQLLEAKRVSLEQKERDIIQREQMVTRLESEALFQKSALEKLRSDTQDTLNNAGAQIAEQYKKEHEKLLKHWEKIKEKHKEFIVKYLNYTESENKESLQPEIQRLRKERQQRVEQLLKTIEGMNPQSCAQMITSMPTEDAIEVLSGLSSTKTAEILSNMAPVKAAELARGLMGPRVPTVPELEDVALPEAPDGKTDTDGEQK
ncbi:MAG: hypothetical protein JXX14_25740 [Deltaproteobacteria bacterium]|nr:hypothetical protein [Deltaproteobacteria bacterium]